MHWDAKRRMLLNLDAICLLLLAVNVAGRTAGAHGDSPRWEDYAAGAAAALATPFLLSALWLRAVPRTSAAARTSIPTLLGVPLRVAGHGTSPGRELAGALLTPLTLAATASGLGAAAVPLAALPSTTLAELSGCLAGMLALLALVTLAPGLPFDGGRALRSALWWWTGDLGYATRVAAGAGQSLAGVGAVAGVATLLGGDPLTGLGIIFPSLAVYAGASVGFEAVTLVEHARGRPCGEAVEAAVCTLGRGTSVAEALERHDTLGGPAVFPIVYGHALDGVVTRQRLLNVPPQRRATLTVAEMMTPATAIPTASPETPLHQVLTSDVLRKGYLPVVQGGQLLGIVMPDGHWRTGIRSLGRGTLPEASSRAA